MGEQVMTLQASNLIKLHVHQFTLQAQQSASLIVAAMCWIAICNLLEGRIPQDRKAFEAAVR